MRGVPTKRNMKAFWQLDAFGQHERRVDLRRRRSTNNEQKADKTNTGMHPTKVNPADIEELSELMPRLRWAGL